AEQGASGKCEADERGRCGTGTGGSHGRTIMTDVAAAPQRVPIMQTRDLTRTPGTDAARAGPLQQHRLVRQLVVAAAFPGKVPSKERSDPQNPDHRALAETAGAVVVLHLAAHRIPLRLADAGCYAAVRDDLDGVIRHEHVDQ